MTGNTPSAEPAGTSGTENPKPVVLQVIPSLGTGGAERGCIDVAAAIVNAGGTALVAAAGGPLRHELARTGARLIELPVDSKNPVTMRANIGRLERIIADEGVDIVHARSRAPAWSAMKAARRSGVPFVTTFHGTYNFNNPVKKLYNSVMARGDRVIAISDFIAEHIARNYRHAGDRVRVIDRGIDLHAFNPDTVTGARMVKLADELRIEDDKPMVLLPGRLVRWKGHTDFIDALSRLSNREFTAVIIGSSRGRESYRAELENRVRKHGLENVVRFAEHSPDMPAVMMLAQVVVSASTDPEAFGRVPPEAQAMGRPVIATDHGGARTTVIQGRTGWLVPPGDPGALAKALESALALTPAQQTEMAQVTREFIQKRFDREQMCARTLAVYQELLTEQHFVHAAATTAGDA